MNVMKQTRKIYKNYEKRVMKLQNSRTWAVLDYQFTEPGNYEVIVKDKNGKSLATNYLAVSQGSSDVKNSKDTDSQQNEKANQKTMQFKIDSMVAQNKDPDRSYYNAKTIFCRSASNGIPKDTGSVFRAGVVNVEVMNDKALMSDSMTVDVFKKGYATEKYPIYVTSKNFRIDAMQNKAYFALNFDQTGEYKIVSYNRRSQMISEGFVTIR